MHFFVPGTVESVMVYVKEELLEVKIECPEDQDQDQGKTET